MTYPYQQIPDIMKNLLLLLFCLRMQVALAQFDYLEHLNMHREHKPVLVTTQSAEIDREFRTVSTHHWVYAATGAPLRHIVVEENDTSRIVFYQYKQQQLINQLVTNARKDTLSYTTFSYKNGFVDTATLYERLVWFDIYTPLVMKKKTVYTRNQKQMITNITDYVLLNHPFDLYKSQEMIFEFENEEVIAMRTIRYNPAAGNIIGTQVADSLNWFRYNPLATRFFPSANRVLTEKNTYIEADTTIRFTQFWYNEFGHDTLTQSMWFVEEKWEERTPIFTQYSYSSNGELLELTRNYRTPNRIIPFFRQQFDGHLFMSVSKNDKVESVARMYPNPARDEVVFHVPEIQESTVAFFYDLSGRLQLSALLNKGENNVQIGALTHGVYFVVISPINGLPVYTTKLIVGP